MNLEELRTLVNYHYWARDRLLDGVAPLSHAQFTERIESSFPSVCDTLVHLCAAEAVWLSRWEGGSPTALPDGRDWRELGAVRTVWTLHERRLRTLLETLGDEGVQRPMAYRGFDGRVYEQPLSQMLQHVVNHGSYHRGQITMMLRQLGMAPPRQMDLVTFHREGPQLRTT